MKWLVFVFVILGYITSSGQQPFGLENTSRKTVYIKDVKSTSTAGGGCTSGAWRTRDLNTLEGDTTFISLSSNQFTLDPGIYEIYAAVPAFYTSRTKAMLYNISDSSNEIEGSALYTLQGDQAVTHSYIKGVFTINSSKTFEIQHRCELTQASNGMGVESGWDDEIYTIVKLTKVRL